MNFELEDVSLQEVDVISNAAPIRPLLGSAQRGRPKMMGTLETLEGLVEDRIFYWVYERELGVVARVVLSTFRKQTKLPSQASRTSLHVWR